MGIVNSLNSGRLLFIFSVGSVSVVFCCMLGAAIILFSCLFYEKKGSKHTLYKIFFRNNGTVPDIQSICMTDTDTVYYF